MTTIRTIILATAAALVAVPAQAQSPRGPDPGRSDPSRSVTLSLTEYNRLLDLANRPGAAAPAAPVAALVASADLRVRVDRDAVSGVFALTGDVLRPGITRVNLIAGATLTDATVDGKPLALSAD